MRTLTKFFALSSIALVAGCSSASKSNSSDSTQNLDSQSTAESQAQDSSQAGIGREVAKEIFRTSALTTDEKSLKYANQVARYVATAVVPMLKCPSAQTTAEQIRVAPVRSNFPSIFSVPGGWIFVTRDSLKALESEDAFAGVIAREIALSLCEKGVPRDLASQAADSWGSYIQALPKKTLSQSDLIWADKVALNALYRVGYDPNHYVRYIEASEIESGFRYGYGRERAAALKPLAQRATGIVPTAPARLNRFASFRTTFF